MTHAAVIAGVAIATIRLVAYAIDNRERWRRFLGLVFLVLAVAVAWWVLADGGVHVLLHDFGLRGSRTRPRMLS